MKAFILVITLVITGQQPVEIEAQFGSPEDCNSARIAALKEAAIFSAHIRRTEESTNQVIAVPQVAAVCRARSSD